MRRKRGRPRKSKDIFVKVGRVGGQAVEVCLNGDNTVEDALEAADLNPKASEDIRVNGNEAELEDVLEDGDRVSLVRQIEGAN